MNYKGIVYYLGLLCFPISILAFINILYSSYFDYFLNISSYIITLIISFLVGIILLFVSKNSSKRLFFIDQLILIILTYFLLSFLIALPFYLSNYQITFLNSFSNFLFSSTILFFALDFLFRELLIAFLIPSSSYPLALGFGP